MRGALYHFLVLSSNSMTQPNPVLWPDYDKSNTKSFHFDTTDRIDGTTGDPVFNLPGANTVNSIGKLVNLAFAGPITSDGDSTVIGTAPTIDPSSFFLVLPTSMIVTMSYLSPTGGPSQEKNNGRILKNKIATHQGPLRMDKQGICMQRDTVNKNRWLKVPLKSILERKKRERLMNEKRKQKKRKGGNKKEPEKQQMVTGTTKTVDYWRDQGDADKVVINIEVPSGIYQTANQFTSVIQSSLNALNVPAEIQIFYDPQTGSSVYTMSTAPEAGVTCLYMYSELDDQDSCEYMLSLFGCYRGTICFTLDAQYGTVATPGEAQSSIIQEFDCDSNTMFRISLFSLSYDENENMPVVHESQELVTQFAANTITGFLSGFQQVVVIDGLAPISCSYEPSTNRILFFADVDELADLFDETKSQPYSKYIGTKLVITSAGEDGVTGEVNNDFQNFLPFPIPSDFGNVSDDREMRFTTSEVPPQQIINDRAWIEGVNRISVSPRPIIESNGDGPSNGYRENIPQYGLTTMYDETTTDFLVGSSTPSQVFMVNEMKKRKILRKRNRVILNDPLNPGTNPEILCISCDQRWERGRTFSTGNSFSFYLRIVGYNQNGNAIWYISETSQLRQLTKRIKSSGQDFIRIRLTDTRDSIVENAFDYKFSIDTYTDYKIGSN